MLVPLPFGGVTPHASAILAVAVWLVAALLLALAGAAAIGRATRRVAWALVALAAFGWLQTVPLPASLVARIAPERARLATQNAAWTERAADRPLALSYAPGATRSAIVDWLTPVGALLAGAAAGRSRRSRRVLLGGLVAAGLFQVVFGAQQWFARSDILWGIRIPGPTNRLRGTFVNANHLATYLAILVAVVFAWIWWSFRRAGREADLETRLRQIALPGLVWIALFVGLAFTGSRAGLLAAAAGCLVQLALVARHERSRGVAIATAAALAAAVVAVGLYGFQAGFGRLLDTSVGATGSADARLVAMGRTFDLWRHAPLTGIGLGAFRAAFPLVQSTGLSDVWWHAHNDWLELVATTGLVGFAIFAAGLWVLLRGLGRGWREGVRSEDRAAALAALGALAAVGLQELADFGLTMPAVAITLAALCGAALAAARTASQRQA